MQLPENLFMNGLAFFVCGPIVKPCPCILTCRYKLLRFDSSGSGAWAPGSLGVQTADAVLLGLSASTFNGNGTQVRGRPHARSLDCVTSHRPSVLTQHTQAAQECVKASMCVVVCVCVCVCMCVCEWVQGSSIQPIYELCDAFVVPSLPAGVVDAPAVRAQGAGG